MANYGICRGRIPFTSLFFPCLQCSIPAHAKRLLHECECLWAWLQLCRCRNDGLVCNSAVVRVNQLLLVDDVAAEIPFTRHADLRLGELLLDQRSNIRTANCVWLDEDKCRMRARGFIVRDPRKVSRPCSSSLFVAVRARRSSAHGCK